MLSGLVSSERCEGGSVPCRSLLAFGGFLVIFDVLWLLDAAFQSVLSPSPGILPVCMCVSNFLLFINDFHHIWLEPNLMTSS